MSRYTPTPIAQAASPSLGALLIERLGVNATLAALFALAISNVLLVALLFVLMSRSGRRG